MSSSTVFHRTGTFDARNTQGSVYRFSGADNIWNSAMQRAGVWTPRSVMMMAFS